MGDFDYAKNKELDEKYSTSENSPLHRANRFPDEHVKALFNDRRYPVKVVSPSAVNEKKTAKPGTFPGHVLGTPPGRG